MDFNTLSEFIKQLNYFILFYFPLMTGPLILLKTDSIIMIYVLAEL